MSPERYQRVFSGILDTFERIAYLAIALALSVPVVMLVFSPAGRQRPSSRACLPLEWGSALDRRQPRGCVMRTWADILRQGLDVRCLLDFEASCSIPSSLAI